MRSRNLAMLLMQRSLAWCASLRCIRRRRNRVHSMCAPTCRIQRARFGWRSRSPADCPHAGNGMPRLRALVDVRMKLLLRILEGRFPLASSCLKVIMKLQLTVITKNINAELTVITKHKCLASSCLEVIMRLQLTTITKHKWNSQSSQNINALLPLA